MQIALSITLHINVPMFEEFNNHELKHSKWISILRKYKKCSFLKPLEAVCLFRCFGKFSNFVEVANLINFLSFEQI